MASLWNHGILSLFDRPRGEQAREILCEFAALFSRGVFHELVEDGSDDGVLYKVKCGRNPTTTVLTGSRPIPLLSQQAVREYWSRSGSMSVHDHAALCGSILVPDALLSRRQRVVGPRFREWTVRGLDSSSSQFFDAAREAATQEDRRACNQLFNDLSNAERFRFVVVISA